MPLTSILIISSFSLLGIGLILLIVSEQRRGRQFVGNLTTGKKKFLVGKVGIFGSWTLFLVKAIWPEIGMITISLLITWVSVILLMTGVAVMLSSFYFLGSSTKMGIPDVETNLRTTGLYRFSRNPMYVGAYLICIGSNIYFPSLLNFSLMLMGVYVHHQLILEEEKFLSSRFGDSYMNYMQHVRRYL